MTNNKVIHLKGYEDVDDIIDKLERRAKGGRNLLFSMSKPVYVGEWDYKPSPYMDESIICTLHQSPGDLKKFRDKEEHLYTEGWGFYEFFEYMLRGVYRAYIPPDSDISWYVDKDAYCLKGSYRTSLDGTFRKLIKEGKLSLERRVFEIKLVGKRMAKLPNKDLEAEVFNYGKS